MTAGMVRDKSQHWISHFACVVFHVSMLPKTYFSLALSLAKKANVSPAKIHATQSLPLPENPGRKVDGPD